MKEDIGRSMPTKGAGWKAVPTIIAMFGANACCALLYDALPPILVSIAQHFGGGEYGQFIAQLASSLPFLGVTLSGLVAGITIERFGLRPVLVFMLILFGLTGSAGLIINEAWNLLATRLVMGFSVGTMLTCCASLVAIRFEGIMRARMNGWLIGVAALCGVTFIFISSYAALWLSWRAPFALHGILAILLIGPAISIGVVPISRVKRDRIGNLKRLKPLIPVFAVAFAQFAIMMMFNIQLAFLLAASGFVSPLTIGRIFALTAGGAMISSFAYGRWGAHVAPVKSIMLGFLLIASGLMVAGLAYSLPFFAVAAIVAGSGSAMSQPALFTWAMRLAPADLSPRAMGFVTTSLYCGGALGPILLTPIQFAFGVRLQFLVCALMIAAVLGFTGIHMTRKCRSVLA